MDELAPQRLDARLRIPRGHLVTPDEITARDRSVPLALVEAVVHDPHASVALPEEIEGWLHPGITDRRRMDFSDFASDALGRHWAHLDPRIVYVRNPVNRLLIDPNRARGDRASLRAQLVEALARVSHLGDAHTVPSLSGVDAIRPITFGGLPVLDATRVRADVDGFLDAVEEAAARTVDVYHRTLGDVVASVIEAKAAMLADISPADVTAEDLARIGHLLVVGLHDTSAFTLTADDRLVRAKAPDDTLPRFIDFGTRGDSNGDPVRDRQGRPVEPTSMRPAAVRGLRQAYVDAFGAPRGFTINDPYKGAHETVAFRDAFGPSSGQTAPRVDVVQFEWSRETLYGPDGAAALSEPGSGWPDEAMEVRADLAPRVVDAHARWRRRRAMALDR